MSFTGLSITQTLLLSAAAAAVLVLLHWLRARPVERRVATTIFWRQAQARLRPRYFWQRLRAPWSLLLMLLIATTLLLAICGPFWQSGADRTPRIVVIEAGPAMAAPDAEGQTGLAAATSAARAFISHLDPRTPCMVVAADPMPRLILASDTPRAKLGESLTALAAVGVPVDLVQTRRFVAQLGREGGEHAAVVWFAADATATRAVVAQHDNATDFTVIQAGRQTSNGVILSAGFVPESSWASRGTLTARVAWFGPQAAELSLHATIANGDEITTEPIAIEPGAIRDVELATIVADGSTVELALSEPAGSPLDNHLTLHLPRRPPLTARVPASLPDALRLALEAVPVELRPADDKTAPEISIVADGPPVSDPSSLQTEAALIGDEPLDWETAHCGTGGTLDATADVTPLLRAGSHVLAAIVRNGDAPPRLLLAAALFAPDSTVPNVAAFPAFVARAARMLGDVEPLPPAFTMRQIANDPTLALGNGPMTRIVGDRIASRTVSLESEDTRLATPAAPWALPSVVMLLGGIVLIAIEGVLCARGWIR